jgi:hypothetical protein
LHPVTPGQIRVDLKQLTHVAIVVLHKHVLREEAANDTISVYQFFITHLVPSMSGAFIVCLRYVPAATVAQEAVVLATPAGTEKTPGSTRHKRWGRGFSGSTREVEATG